MKANTMNTATTVLFLAQVGQRYPDNPILLLYDRAKWHSGQAVKDFLGAHPRIEVMKLPQARRI